MFEDHYCPTRPLDGAVCRPMLFNVAANYHAGPPDVTEDITSMICTVYRSMQSMPHAARKMDPIRLFAAYKAPHRSWHSTWLGLVGPVTPVGL